VYKKPLKCKKCAKEADKGLAEDDKRVLKKSLDEFL
jgi:hypothetical protein